MGKLFGTDGVRDKANQGFLSPGNVTRLGQAIAGLLKKSPRKFRNRLPNKLPLLKHTKGKDSPYNGKILIGGDTRESTISIKDNLIKGLGGIPIVTVGVLPTPAIAHLTREWGCILGVVISASHNPYDDNGIKLISPEGLKIPDSAEESIEKLFFDKKFGQKIKYIKDTNILDASKDAGKYVNDAVENFRNIFSLEGIKLILDCANGATSAVAPQIFERLGAKVKVLNNKPNGRNINRNCGALYPERLAKVVVKEKAKIGVAFDGDGDRAMFVDEKGNIRDGDYVLALSAKFMKEKDNLPSNTVVSTVMANLGLEKYLESIGVKLIRTKVGDRYVCEEMIKRNALLGGEQSGHIIFLDTETTGDGIITALKVLEVMVGKKSSLYKLSQPMKKYPQVILNVAVKSKPPLEEVGAVKSAISEADNLLKENGRIVVRYSGTEPKARVMVEGPKEELINNIAKKIAYAISSTIG